MYTRQYKDTRRDAIKLSKLINLVDEDLGTHWFQPVLSFLDKLLKKKLMRRENTNYTLNCSHEASRQRLQARRSLDGHRLWL